MKTVFLRLILLGLSLYSSLLAWAGVESARGKAFLNAEAYSAAADAFTSALKSDPLHPETLLNTGLSYWQLWLSERRGTDLEAARFYFERTLRFQPHSAKAQYYAALAEKQELQRQEKWTGKDRERNRAAFRKARELEPHSPWMVIYTHLESYGDAGDITAKERKKITREVRTALSWHYRHQVSPYLLPVYEWWWSEFQDPQMLRRVTPKESLSYFRLLEFLKREKAWKAYASVYPAYTRLNRRFYREVADEADTWLGAGMQDRAHAAYAFARKQRPFAARAVAGLLASGTGPFSEDERASLRRVLLQEEENVGFYLEGIAARMKLESPQDSFVRGLLAWREGRAAQAIRFLEETSVDRPERRRLLAQAYLEQGKNEKAAGLLQGALSEGRAADLRELFLLQRLADIEHIGPAVKIHEAVLAARTRKIDAEAWRYHSGDKTVALAPRQSAGTEVNLQPGRVRLKLWLKTENLPQGLVRVSLWENDRRQYESPAAVTASGGLNVWEFETTGGWRWLQVEFSRENDGSGGEVLLRLGPGTLEYPE